MKVYLDNCCFNRPFDDQNQIRIRIETEAKLHIQLKIEEGVIQLIWSYILDYENVANPFEIRQISIEKWKHKAAGFVNESNEIIEKAKELAAYNFKAKDALHLSCAIREECEYFVTTDDQILNKNSVVEAIEILSPVDLIKLLEE